MLSTNLKQEEVTAQFRQICGLRNKIDANDSTDIRIKEVSGQGSQFYIKTKGYYSLKCTLPDMYNWPAQ